MTVEEVVDDVGLLLALILGLVLFAYAARLVGSLLDSLRNSSKVVQWGTAAALLAALTAIAYYSWESFFIALVFLASSASLSDY